MSQDELVNAYIDGSVSRRTFIRRLVTAGVSLGAAVSYAHLLSPSRADARNNSPDFYKPGADQFAQSTTPLLVSASSGGGKKRKRKRKKRKKRR
jgi:hypothetical protein